MNDTPHDSSFAGDPDPGRDETDELVKLRERVAYLERAHERLSERLREDEQSASRGLYKPRDRGEVLILEQGQRLVTDFITIVAMRGNATVDVECNCTEARPDRPDCEYSVETIPGGIRVNCTPVGGCRNCGPKVRLPSQGVMLESGRMLLL